MLTGALPFQGKDRKETMNLILKWVFSGWKSNPAQKPVVTYCYRSKFHLLISGEIIWAACAVCLSLQGASGNASVLERRGPVPAQGFVQEEPRQQTGLVSTHEHDFHKWQHIHSFSVRRVKPSSVFPHICVIEWDSYCWLSLFTGSNADGAEEIKRHGFFSTIDWNVSVWLSRIFHHMHSKKKKNTIRGFSLRTTISSIIISLWEENLQLYDVIKSPLFLSETFQKRSEASVQTGGGASGRHLLLWLRVHLAHP